MSPFRKPIKLRGTLGCDVESPAPQVFDDNACVVLSLSIESITSDKPTGLQILRTAQIPIVCCGPDFCGAHSGMKEGDSIEVCGELRLCEEDGPVVWTRQPRVTRISGPKIRASHVHRLNRADIVGG